MQYCCVLLEEKLSAEAENLKLVQNFFSGDSGESVDSVDSGAYGNSGDSGESGESGESVDSVDSRYGMDAVWIWSSSYNMFYTGINSPNLSILA